MTHIFKLVPFGEKLTNVTEQCHFHQFCISYCFCFFIQMWNSKRI